MDNKKYTYKKGELGTYTLFDDDLSLVCWLNEFDAKLLCDILNGMDEEIFNLKRELSKEKLEKWRITNFFKNLPDSNYNDYFFDHLMRGSVPL